MSSQRLRPSQDGEFEILLGGRNITVFCHNINSTPREFLSLPTGERENYSEVFGLRLINPESCPNNGSRQSCPCVTDDSPRVGVTAWSKISLNISSLSVNRKSAQVSPVLTAPLYFQPTTSSSPGRWRELWCPTGRRETATASQTVPRAGSASTSPAPG